MSSLATEYPKEQARCRELLQAYRELPGGVGVFGAMHIEAVLKRADEAAASGDVIAMLQAYEAMQGCE